MGCCNTKQNEIAVSDKLELHEHSGEEKRSGDKPKGIALSQLASDSSVGVPFPVQPHIRLVDEHGATVPSNGYAVTVSVLAPKGGVLLPKDKCRGVSVNGVVHFSGLYVDGPPANYILEYNCSDVGTTTQEVAVVALGVKPAGIQLIIPATSPSYLGVAFATQPRVRLVNSTGGLVPVSGYLCTASITGMSGQSGTLLPPMNVTAVSILGYFFFTGLYITGDPGQYSMNFNTSDVGNASQIINMLDSEVKELSKPLHITVVDPASDSHVNAVFDKQPRVRLTDESGKTVPVNDIVVTATVSGGEGQLLPSASCSAKTIAGFATFEGLHINTPGTYTVTYNCENVGNAVQTLNIYQQTTSVKPAGIQLIVDASSPSVLGVPFATQPRVRLVNSTGGLDPVSGYLINAFLTNSGGLSGTLNGLTTVATQSGYSFFSNLYVTGDPGQYTLNFNCSDVGNCSQPLVITSSTKAEKKSESNKPTGLELAIAASSPSVVGKPFAVQPCVRLVDPSGATVPLSGVAVNATLSGPSGHTAVLLPSSATHASTVTGYAYFVGLCVVGSPGTYTINFTCEFGHCSQKIQITE